MAWYNAVLFTFANAAIERMMALVAYLVENLCTDNFPMYCIGIQLIMSFG
jgi:hypothetical protein